MAKTVTSTLVFVDVVGSSKLRRGRGESAAQESLRALRDLMQENARTHHGRVANTAGDGLLLAFASARDAVNCAISIQRDAAGRRQSSPTSLPQVRVGINVGEVIEEDEDVFGLPVDAAEHIQSKAKGGEILASELVRGVVGATEDVQFVERGRFRLKNFPGRWRLYEVPWQERRAAKDSVTCAFVVCDLVESTPLFERLGDEAAVEVIRAYHAIARAELASFDAFWTKFVGDGIIAAFRSPGPAVGCAIALQRAFAVRSDEHAGEPLHARIALHVGEVIREADDFFGRALNFAVRLSGQGKAGTIFASRHFRELAEPDELVRYGKERRIELRGFQGRQPACEVHWR